MSRAVIVDPLLANFDRKLERVKLAGPFELPAAVKEFTEAAAAVIRDTNNRLRALERAAERQGNGELGAVM